MKAALFGLPGSGRKTLMEALRGGASEAMGRRSVVTISVPDGRVGKLSEIFQPRKTTCSTIEITLEDSGSDSLSKMLAGVRNMDVLVYMVGAFMEGDDGPTKAQASLEALQEEMILADMAIVEKRLAILKKIGDKGPERHLFERISQALEEMTFLNRLPFDEGEAKILAIYNFLTLKPLLMVINVAEGVKDWGGEGVVMCASLEAEIAHLSEEEQGEYLEAMGIAEPASHRLVHALYRSLSLISFLTVGKDEVRAWPVRTGSTAPIAAGRIHSDIQRGFIRAEVVSYDDFIQSGNLAVARKKGVLRLEGKEYLVKDGDIINFLFNV